MNLAQSSYRQKGITSQFVFFMADFEAVNPDEGDNIWVACTDGDIEVIDNIQIPQKTTQY